MRFALSVVFTFAFALTLSAQEPALVAPTNALTPAEEQKTFRLPPGFEMQLVAAEPDIHKPLNLNFDDRGRLWVTDTVEYPFPAAPGKKARDTVKILEDFGPDGKADPSIGPTEGVNKDNILGW